MAKVRHRFGENEIEVEGDAKFIKTQLDEFFEKVRGLKIGITKKEDLTAKIAEVPKPKKVRSPREFYREKNPSSGTEKLIVLAKYLEDYRSISEFKPENINKLAKETKIKDIHPQYFTLAVQQGLIRTIGKGKYSLTLSGEDAVIAMPTKKSTL